MSNYEGVMVVGEYIKRLVVASYDDSYVGDSLDMDFIVVGEPRYQVIVNQSEPSGYGGPFLSIAKISLFDLMSIDSALYDEISAEDVEYAY